MKNNFKYIIIAVLVLGSTACSEDFLEFVPEDQATVGSWYQNETQIRASTGVLYGSPWFLFNDEFMWCAGDLMSGDMFHNWTNEGQFFYFSFTSTNPYLGDGWQALYNVISNANLIISDMPSISAGYGVSDEVINAGLAEARFMRAMAYYFLVEYWGEVPIIEDPAAIIASGDLTLSKHTVGSVYEFIRRDLEFAKDNLPNADQDGRVTSWAAKGFLAKLHVTLGQRSVGGGSVGSSNDFDIAAGYAADVINNSGRSLYPSYEDLFRPENENNDEVLFAFQWINAGYGVGNSRLPRFARSAALTGNTSAWGDGKGATVDFQNNVIANAEGAEDLRRKAIYMQLGDTYDYLNVPNGGYEYFIRSRRDDGTIFENPSATLTNLKKFVIGGIDDHGYLISNQDSPLNSYILRMADVYLLYTEALMGSNGSLGSGPGLDALNAVRARAGLGARITVTYEQLWNERRIEMGMEGLSWLEIKRRYYRDDVGTLAHLNGQNRTHRYYIIDSNDQTEENSYSGYEYIAPGGERTERDESGNVQFNIEPVVTVTASDMILPVPANEIVTNGLLDPEVEAVEYVFE